MSASTGIGWCDATFNPWWGCERVSPGCAHCYADTLATRYGHADTWGVGHGFRFFGDKHWAEPLKWAAKARRGLLPDGTANPDGHRPRVFCASMADVFEDRPELNEHRRRLFELIEETPELDWLILTKRPEFAREWLGRAFHWRASFEGAHANVWLGVSIENARFAWRADVLRQIPAAVRFISAEPLLGSLYPGSHTGTNRRHAAPVGQSRTSGSSGQGAHGPNVGRGGEEASPAREKDPVIEVGRRSRSSAPLDLTDIDWVIIGGESGPGARPFHLEHAREIIRARAARVWRSPPAVFVKQFGAKPVQQGLDPIGDGGRAWPLKLRDRKGENPAEWPADLRIQEWPRSAA